MAHAHFLAVQGNTRQTVRHARPSPAILGCTGRQYLKGACCQAWQRTSPARDRCCTSTWLPGSLPSRPAGLGGQHTEGLAHLQEKSATGSNAVAQQHMGGLERLVHGTQRQQRAHAPTPIKCCTTAQFSLQQCLCVGVCWSSSPESAAVLREWLTLHVMHISDVRHMHC